MTQTFVFFAVKKNKSCTLRDIYICDLCVKLCGKIAIPDGQKKSI